MLAKPLRVAQGLKRGPKPSHAVKLAFIKQVEQEMNEFWPKNTRKTMVTCNFMITEFSALMRRVLKAAS